MSEPPNARPNRGATVLHSLSTSWLPQTQVWLYDLVRHLPGDVQSHVVCRRVENLDQFPIDRLHCRETVSGRWKAANLLLRLVGVRHSDGYLPAVGRQTGAQLLHSHFAPAGWMNIDASRVMGVPLVTSFYGYDLSLLPRQAPIWKDRYLKLFDAAARILCEGPHMADCIQALGCPEDKLTVHPLGVDLEQLAFRPRAWNGSEPLGVLIASAFREKKGIPLAIRALGRISSDVELRITLVGDEIDSPSSRLEAVRIREAIDEVGLVDQIESPGFLPWTELVSRSFDHHVFLAPSRTASDGDTEGGAPVSLIQLAATGIVIVSSDHCDIPQVVQHGHTGFLAREGDLDDLEVQLRAALEANDRWHDIALAGRRHVQKGFDARIQGEHLASIYRECIEV